ncbi:hypothetical protein C8Q72DRAFT_5880 [Fomitopsis betulina]|nr:hypothetical protein C8Q72DRAFT_5880 [Fomitopsis betulina]
MSLRSPVHVLRRSTSQAVRDQATLPLRSLILDRCSTPPFLSGLLAAFVFPTITDLRLDDVRPDSVDAVLPVLRECAPNVVHLQLSFHGRLLIGSSRSERDTRGEISKGGFPDLPALQSVHLTAPMNHLPAILEPLSASSYLRDLTIRGSAYLPPDEAVVQSVLTLARARPSLTLSFLWQMYTNPRRSRKQESLILEEMRDQLLLIFAELREEGRLRFVRYKDTQRQMSMRGTTELEEF